MEFLNIGIPELFVILLLMLIFLGPEGMVKTARTLAQTARKIVRSPMWADLMRAQNEIKDIPTRMMREAGIDELQAEMRQVQRDVTGDIKSAYQSIPMDPVTIRPASLESGEPLEPGDSPYGVGRSVEEPPEEESTGDTSGEDKP